MADRFFFDTYALIERQSGSAAYAPFAPMPVFTHQFNLYEFVTAIVRVADEGRAREELRLLAPNLLEAETDDLFAAARFKRLQARKRVSYVDALGYVLARKHGMRFLTGDRAFKGIENVEHVA